MRPVVATPGFVPHEAWEKFAWLLPVHHGKEPWYWATPLTTPPETRKIPTEPDFIKTVDPAIRSLVAWFHRKGIPTGPSCAGHDLSRRGFKQIYEDLRGHEEQVRGPGLELRDPEHGDSFLMQEEEYYLPWESLEAFRAAAESHQPVGWLPFYTTDLRIPLLLGSYPGFEIKKTGGSAYGIKTTGENPNAWKLSEELVRRALT